MQHHYVEKRQDNHILLLIALRKLGGKFEFSPEDYEWSKKHNIEVVYNGGLEKGGSAAILKPREWPPSSRSS